MVKLTINGNNVEVPEGTSVLEAAKTVGINIPTLCYLKGINCIGACRICLVEVKGARALQSSCTYPVSEGMEVRTNTKTVRDARKTVLELILSDHKRECLSCIRNGSCELQMLSDEMGIKDVPYLGMVSGTTIDESSPSIVRDASKCVLCRRCVAVCKGEQGIAAIGEVNRGFATEIAPAFDKKLGEVQCVNCGQCISACPVGALYEKDSTEAVWAAIDDPSKHVVFQPAPAVRVALGEEFGMPVGTRVTGKMAAAIRRLGGDRVFDTDFGADLTIMEEGTELLHRIKENGTLPMVTSCSPGWIKYCEHNYPDLLPNLSTCKSPHQMVGALLKSYYAEKNGIDPKDVFAVSIMPCTAKKFERQRPEMARDGIYDVDAVITTRELARMIKQAGIDFTHLPEEDFDPFYGDSTGAAVIFGATGGVMEAAIRTVADILTGEDIEAIDYKDVRGLEGVKEATVSVAGMDIKVAVAHGTANAAKLMDKIRDGSADHHFIEIMGCPGGCVSGGGQPIVQARIKMELDPKALRAAAIYDEDKNMDERKSHKNLSVKKLYDDYLGEPCGHKSHELLHTHYTPRKKFGNE